MRKDTSKLAEKFFSALDSMLSRGESPKTLWEIFLSLLGKNHDKAILTLKADLPILQQIVEGKSPYAVSKFFGIASKDVFNVCYTWGFIPQISTLDVNPFSIYEDGISLQTFINMYNLITPITIDTESARRAIINIEHFNDILSFIKEYDDGES